MGQMWMTDISMVSIGAGLEWDQTGDCVMDERACSTEVKLLFAMGGGCRGNVEF